MPAAHHGAHGGQVVDSRWEERLIGHERRAGVREHIALRLIFQNNVAIEAIRKRLILSKIGAPLVFKGDEAGDIQGVDDTRDVTQDGEQDVDEQVGTASALEEDT